MGGRPFPRVVPGALVVATAMARTVLGGGSGGGGTEGPSSACAVETSRRLGITDRFEWCGTPVLAAD